MALTRIKSTGIANTQSFTLGAASVTGNLTVSSVTDLGNVGNVKITGGVADYVLRTDGSGNLSWVAQTGGGGGADQYARDTANAGFLQANSAYDSQNTTGTYANSAYGQANSAALYANAAFIQANAAYAAANAGGAGTDQFARDTANAAFIQANAAFIQANTGGIQVYATLAELPLSGNDAGDQAYVEENNRLYIWTGVGWFNIALINTNPTITSGPNASYVLAANGTPTVLTLVASDPEGLPITWSYQVTSGSLGSTATIVQSGNVFTITPSTNTDHAGTFGVTFTASDGVNLATAASTFTLSFQPRWDTTTQQAKLIASDYQASDNFGWSVAISGDTVVVGATLEDPNNITDAGSVYIFTRSGTTWTQQAKIQASDAQASDQFGESVAIDGDTVVVSAQYEDPGNITTAGSAYIFTRSGTTWTQQAKLVASDYQTNDYFGVKVAISGDTVVVGANGEDTVATGAGAAYVFTRSGTTWTQQQKIQASDAQASSVFGTSVAIDGNTVVVGASLNDPSSIIDAGAAYVFTRSGTTWTQQQKIQASDAQASDNFGQSVGISGNTVVVGAYAEDPNNISGAGSVYIFTRSGTTWTQQAKLIASDAQASDLFGQSVAIEGDTVVVGAYNEDPNNITDAGSAYVFTRSGATWTQQAKLIASDAQASDLFGQSVGISGNTVVVGAYAEDPNNISGAGSVYVFIAA